MGRVMGRVMLAWTCYVLINLWAVQGQNNWRKVRKEGGLVFNLFTSGSGTFSTIIIPIYFVQDRTVECIFSPKNK